ncbi:MAG TPA: lysylphosphatidylglycerol synthase transmembrane domain-containing protein [Thermoanaerobaculia bacterium]|nr:lysylphosphatidylglycerol synthase transmembrane domain-containing protein [Thermoanaerobaculia bacterium]
MTAALSEAPEGSFRAPTAASRRKRWISIAVSLGLLALIYRKIDLRAIGGVLRASDPAWMVVGQLALVLIKAVQAWRLRRLMPRGTRLGTGESVRLILVADVMNMVLPSKMGDIAKAYFLKSRGHLTGSFALSLTVFEKAYDVLALFLWCAIGLVLLPGKGWALWTAAGGMACACAGGFLVINSGAFARLVFGLVRKVVPPGPRAKVERLEGAWRETRAYFRRERSQHAQVIAISIGLWLLHFVQLWIFILALRAWCPFLVHVGLASLAILAGLVPFTFAGLGTRDAALIALYRPYLDPQTAAALGLLFTSRYLLPALAGLPFFRGYLEELRGRGQEIPG